MTAFLLLEQNDVAEAGTGGKTGNQSAEADRAADKQLAEQHAHRTARDQTEHRAQQRLEDAVGQHEGSDTLLTDAVHDHVEREQHDKQEDGGLDGVGQDVRHRRGLTAAVAHLDLERAVGSGFVLTEHGAAQNIAADDRDRKLDHEQQHHLLYACAACQHDGHRLIRGGKEHGNQRCRCKKACREQRGRCRGKSALGDGAGERADHRTELRRTREQLRRIGQPVFNVVQQCVHDQQQRYGLEYIEKCFRQNVMDNF